MGVKRYQSLCLRIVLLKVALMIGLRGESLCLEYNMARDRVLKVNFRVVHMDQERGVDLGNRQLEWHWGKHWEEK